MARIGGRNRWIAVPAGILCAGVLAGLVWLSLPMLPASVAWVDDTARSALSRSLLAPPTAPAAPSLEHDLECSTIYPADLWTELVWTPRALLSQTAAPPATSAASLVDALAPTVRITCAWRGDEGAKTISTTLAKVGSDAGALADVALRGAGFTCGAVPGGVECVLERGDVIEEHVVRDGYWLSTVETAWHPERYGARISAYLFG